MRVLDSMVFGVALVTAWLGGCVGRVGGLSEVEVKAVEEVAPRAAIRDAPLDSEAALLGGEALAAAAGSEAGASETEAGASETGAESAERAREVCERRCTQPFDRDAMVRRMIEASIRAEHVGTDIDHGKPPSLGSEVGTRRFLAGEPSTIWYLDGPGGPGSYAVAIYVNPNLEDAGFPFHGTLIEIDEHDRVVGCRHAARDQPEEAIEMRCPGL